MAEHIDIDHLRGWIGREECASDVVTPELAKRFRATLSGYTELGSQLPLGIHWCLAPPAVAGDALGSDGHPFRGDFIPPVPLPRRMWASSRLHLLKPIEIGTTVAKTSTLADVTLKHSTSAGPLVFVDVEHEYRQEAVTLIRERQTLVYRQLTTYRAPEPKEPRPAARTLDIQPDSTLLFRYSALTFNGHRIHYDHPYATGAEGYPDLVVQGPLMATLLMNLAQAARPGQPMREFAFRGVAPALVDRVLRLMINTRDADALEARNPQDALIMTAEAVF